MLMYDLTITMTVKKIDSIPRALGVRLNFKYAQLETVQILWPEPIALLSKIKTTKTRK